MKVAIHQPHYFPWLGYFDKMAKVDRFVIMDQVQFVPRSYMSRNSFLARNGELEHLTVTVWKHGYQDKTISEIETINCKEWQNKHVHFLKDNYRYFPYFNEIMGAIESIFISEFYLLFDVLTCSIRCIADILDIQTELLLQSSLGAQISAGMVDCEIKSNEFSEKQQRQCNDVVSICVAAQADIYLTGRGKSVEFVNPATFLQAGVQLAYQDYECPQYEQHFSQEFVCNISALDMLFNCGIEKSREIFWNNVHSTNEFNK